MKFKYRITAEVTISRSVELEITSLKNLAAAQTVAVRNLEREIHTNIRGESKDPKVRIEQIALRPTDKRY